MACVRAFAKVLGFKLKEKDDGNNYFIPVPAPSPSSENGIVYIEGTNVNLRNGPGTDYGVIRKLGK